MFQYGTLYRQALRSAGERQIPFRRLSIVALIVVNICMSIGYLGYAIFLFREQPASSFLIIPFILLQFYLVKRMLQVLRPVVHF